MDFKEFIHAFTEVTRLLDSVGTIDNTNHSEAIKEALFSYKMGLLYLYDNDNYADKVHDKSGMARAKKPYLDRLDYLEKEVPSLFLKDAREWIENRFVTRNETIKKLDAVLRKDLKDLSCSDNFINSCIKYIKEDPEFIELTKKL